MGYMEINPFKDEDNYLLKRGLPRSDYVRGSEECGGCNEQYDFLIAVEISLVFSVSNANTKSFSSLIT